MLSRRRLLQIAAPAIIGLEPKVIQPVEAFYHASFGTPPAPASAHGYVTRTFFDDFTSLSTIDVNNTRAPGYKWYVQNWDQTTALPASAIHINNSILKLDTNAGNYTEGLISCTPTSANNQVWTDANGYIGSTFSNGMYIEFSAAADPALSTSGATAWPAVWSDAVRFRAGCLAAGPFTFTELDFFEYFPNGNGAITPHFAIGDWSLSSCTSGSGSFNSNDVPSLGSPTYTNQNIFGTLWVPMAKNSGTGIIQRYFNGVHRSECDISWTAGGQFSGLDSELIELIIGAGVNWPIYVDYVAVWQ